MTMKAAIIIPARYGSTRFPGKPLAMIAGQTMLSRVVDVARKAAQGLECDVIVATDDDRITAHAKEIEAHYVMTPESCKTGSDRVWAAVEKLPQPVSHVINLQGDAPFTPPHILRKILETLQSNEAVCVATPVHQLSWEALDRLRENKRSTPYSGTTAVFDNTGRALWFSKMVLPAIRKEEGLRQENALSPVWQHMGLYGYRTDILERYVSLPEGVYEKLEGLEQLRFLENNIPVTCVPVENDEGTLHSGIDTPEDVKRAEALLF